MRFDRAVVLVRHGLLPAFLFATLAIPVGAFWPGDHAHRGAPRRTYCVLAVAPMDLTLTRLDPATAGTPRAPFRLRIAVTAQAACDAVTLKLDLPAGAAMHSRVSSWTGPMARGAQRELVLWVSVPDDGLRRFFAVAEVRKGTATLLRQAHVEVGRAPSGLSAPRFLNHVITAPDGTRMMVLPAREVSP